MSVSDLKSLGEYALEAGDKAAADKQGNALFREIWASSGVHIPSSAELNRRAALAIARRLPENRAAAEAILKDALSLLGWVADGVFEQKPDSD